MRINKELIGKEVINSDASVVGNIIDICVDLKDTHIDVVSLIVSKKENQKLLSFNKEEIVIPLSFVETIGDKVILFNSFESEDSSVDFKNNKSKDSPDDISNNGKNSGNEDYELDDLDLDKFEEELIDLKARL